MDTTMAWASLAHPQVKDVSTVHLDIQYIRPAQKVPLTCAARVVHRTSRTCFLHAEILDAEDCIVATGQGTCRTFSQGVSQFVP